MPLSPMVLHFIMNNIFGAPGGSIMLPLLCAVTFFISLLIARGIDEMPLVAARGISFTYRLPMYQSGNQKRAISRLEDE